MAHYAHLYAHNKMLLPIENGKFTGSFALHSRYRVPIFWLAMFQNQDLRWHQEEEEESVPYLATTKTNALDTLKSREKNISTVIPSIYEDVFKQFCVSISDLREKYILLDSSDIAMLSATPQEWANILRLSLQAFDTPLEGERKHGFWAKLFGKDGLNEGWRYLDPPDGRNGRTIEEIASLVGHWDN